MLRFATVALTALLLAGCSSSNDGGGSDDGAAGPGSGGGATSPTTSAPPTGPACDDVWQAGKTLPGGYERCTTDGAYGSQDVTTCTDGTKLVAYLDTFYAVTGQKIVQPDLAPMQDTPEFGKVFSACTGE